MCLHPLSLVFSRYFCRTNTTETKMRRILYVCAVWATATAALAVPAKKGQWKTVTLEDGTQVMAELTGDEYGHFWQAEDGTAYVMDSTRQWYVPAEKKSMLERADSLRAAAHSARIQKKSNTRGDIGGEHDPYTGTKKGLIILVEFADTQFLDGHDKELYDSIANGVSYTSSDGFVGSVRDYYAAQSDDVFTIDFDIVGPVTAKYGYAYYGQDTSSSIDVNISQLLVEALDDADSQVDFSDYDWDGDGYVDLIFLLYAGLGEANGGDENTIWPHQGQFSVGWKYDGVTINKYACSCELQSETQIDGIGTFCHEFSHCLGLPDMYDTNYENYGMGYWDVMCYGCYLGDSFIPCAYTSYERMYCGWQQPTEITADTTVTDMGPLGNDGETYIIYNEGHTDEYYLLENRQRTGWDASLYGEGLLVMHVDFDSDIWSDNLVNTTSDGNDHQRCTVIPADNSTDITTVQSVAGDLYPYGSNNALSQTTTPANELYNMNADGTYYLGKSILNITQNNDGTIAFNVTEDDSLDSDTPDGALFYESFSLCLGKGGNDGTWSGNGVAAGTFVADNDGWSSTVKYAGYQCARFGSNAQNGKATTPEFDIDGTTVLSFNAAPWPGDGTTLTVTVNEGNAELSETSFDMTSGEWTQCTATLTGSGTVSLTFKSSSRRFYLDEVLVMPYELSGIKDVTVDPSKNTDSRIFSLDGMYMGTDFDSLKKGVYIIGGHKYVK